MGNPNYHDSYISLSFNDLINVTLMYILGTFSGIMQLTASRSVIMRFLTIKIIYLPAIISHNYTYKTAFISNLIVSAKSATKEIFVSLTIYLCDNCRSLPFF